MGDLSISQSRVRDGSGFALGKCSTDTGFSVVRVLVGSRIV